MSVEIRTRDYWRPAIQDSHGNFYKMTKTGPKIVSWRPMDVIYSTLRKVKTLTGSKLE